MTGLVRKATFLAVLGLLAATTAFAGVPSCANSTFPTFIDLVGCAPGGTTVDPRGTFTITVRDIGNFPVVNQLVSVLFKSDVTTYDSDYCLEATTNASGVATFRVPGSGRNSAGTALYKGTGAARIFLGSCALTGWCATANVCTYDENGYVSTKGVEITDLAAWAPDFLVGTDYRPRSDFSHNGAVDIIDLSNWATVYLGAGSSAACTGSLFLNPTW